MPLADDIAAAVASHHGTVDSAPYIRDMLLYNCIWYFLFANEIVDSHTMQIHCLDAVIVRSIAARFTLEDM